MIALLRCTVAGLIPLMKSEKYAIFAEEFYQTQISDFSKIIKNKSYYLLRELPVNIATQILLPEIPAILSNQKNNGLWHNSTKVTYDILSAFKHIHVLDDLISRKKLKNTLEQIANKNDYDSLLIKSKIYQQIDEKDIIETKKIIQEIQDKQNENGSWEETVVATVHYLEKLVNLGVSSNDNSVQKAIAFLFKNLHQKWEGLQSSGKVYGLKSEYFFSNENRDLEFESAEKYRKEDCPKLICYRHLGVMQSSGCLNLLVQIGLEHNELVECALDNLFSVFKNYKSLCYFTIQKKFITKQKKRHAQQN